MTQLIVLGVGLIMCVSTVVTGNPATAAPPAAAKPSGPGQSDGPREMVVAQDGSGTYRTVQEAVAAAPTGTREHPTVVRVRPGTYREIVYLQHEKRFLRLIGDDPATTVVTYDLNANMPGPDGKPIGTFRTPTATFDADDLTVENLSFVNAAGNKGQALAVRIDGDRITFRNCQFTGWQDTILDNRGRHFYQNCMITGATDFIFGAGTGFFEGCQIVCAGSGFVTAASTPSDQPYGFIFSNCKVSGVADDVRSYLGRPWRDYAQTTFTNCELGAVVRPEGWSNWNHRDTTARYGEYRCFGPGASSRERVPWSKKLKSPEGDALTADHVLAGTDGWNPRAGYAFGATVTTDILYGMASGERLLLDASTPAAATGSSFPIVVFVHGGGWSSGDKEDDIAPLLGPLLSPRFAWFTINYRLSAKAQWPACQEDVATAIRWIRAHASEYNGDPNRLAVIGYSAGGQLAMRAAVDTAPEMRAQAAVGFAAPTDIEADTASRGGLSASLMPLFGHSTPNVDDDARTKMREMSAIDHVPASATQLPPFLLVHGTADKSVPYNQSINFQAKLKATGASCDLLTLPDAPHAVAQWTVADAGYREKVVAWLVVALAPQSAHVSPKQ